MLTKVNNRFCSAATPSLQFQSQMAEQADAASRQLVALSYSAISFNPKTVSAVSKLQFTNASGSSHSWLSKQPSQCKVLSQWQLAYAMLILAQLSPSLFPNIVKIVLITRTINTILIFPSIVTGILTRTISTILTVLSC